jgi:hypothetical protein
MIGVHFAKISTTYPCVVISSLAKWLENLFLSFFTLPLMYDPGITTCHYNGLLQEFVMIYYDFPWPQTPLAVLRFPLTSGPSYTLWIQITSCVVPHIIKQDLQYISSLISKQVVSYRTRGDTCCPEVSIPKIRCLADSSNHILWWT